MWVLPSRSRPGNVARFINACHDQGIPAPLWLRVDLDDERINGYRRLDLPDGWAMVEGPRDGLASLYNAAFKTLQDRPFYGVLADDIVPETKDWDKRLIEAAGSDGLAFGDDGINGSIHATHFVLGGDLVREIGWLALPGLSRIFIDTAWVDIARSRGVLRYLPDVILRHHHFSNGRAFFDGTYRKPDKAADRAIYDAWRNTKETT